MVDKCTLSNFDEVFSKSFHLDLFIDFDKKVLSGSVVHEVTVPLEQSKPVHSLVFDTRNLNVSAVSDAASGAALPWKYGPKHDALGTPLIIDIGSTESGATRRVKIEYETSPGDLCPAGQFLSAAQTADKKHPFFFTQCQAILARSLIPIQDTPARKQTFTARLRVMRPLVALMGALQVGEAVEDPQDPAFRFFSYEQKVPIPSYLVTLLAGHIERRDISHRCGVWAEPSLLEAAAHEFAEVEQFVAATEEVARPVPYVWGRYDLAMLPPSFPYGGMENPNLTFVTPTLIAGDRSNTNVVIHEIAHSWSGNLVTNASWSDFWMNEGFTVYLERAVLRKLRGEDAFNLAADLGWQELKEDVEAAPPQYTRLVPELEGVDPDDAFSKIPYEKGFAFLLYLQRLVVGEDYQRFYRFIGEYFDNYKYGTVSYPYFKSFFLSQFPPEQYPQVNSIEWDKWLFDTGMPHIRPEVDTRPLKSASELTDRVLADLSLASLSAADRDLSSWPAVLQCIFLKKLKDRAADVRQKAAALGPNTPHVCAALDEVYGFSKTRNAEIKSAWCELGVELDWQPILPLVESFLGEQGRLKYCRPLYRGLALKGGDLAKLARRIYEANKASYHAVNAKYCGNDVALGETKSPAPAPAVQAAPVVVSSAVLGAPRVFSYYTATGSPLPTGAVTLSPSRIAATTIPAGAAYIVPPDAPRPPYSAEVEPRIIRVASSQAPQWQAAMSSLVGQGKDAYLPMYPVRIVDSRSQATFPTDQRGAPFFPGVPPSPLPLSPIPGAALSVDAAGLSTPAKIVSPLPVSMRSVAPTLLPQPGLQTTPPRAEQLPVAHAQPAAPVVIHQQVPIIGRPSWTLPGQPAPYPTQVIGAAPSFVSQPQPMHIVPTSRAVSHMPPPVVTQPAPALPAAAQSFHVAPQQVPLGQPVPQAFQMARPPMPVQMIPPQMHAQMPAGLQQRLSYTPAVPVGYPQQQGTPLPGPGVAGGVMGNASPRMVVLPGARPGAPGPQVFTRALPMPMPAVAQQQLAGPGMSPVSPGAPVAVTRPSGAATPAGRPAGPTMMVQPQGFPGMSAPNYGPMVGRPSWVAQPAGLPAGVRMAGPPGPAGFGAPFPGAPAGYAIPPRAPMFRPQ